MTWRRRARAVSVVAAVGGITLSAFTYLRYRRDIRDARGRVAARSRVADTPCGPIEYAMARTPLPADASPAPQADAYASLLDALHVPSAVVIGASAGGPSSMHFALWHPQRTDALILLVPLAYPQHIARRASPAMRWALETSLGVGLRLLAVHAIRQRRPDSGGARGVAGAAARGERRRSCASCANARPHPAGEPQQEILEEIETLLTRRAPA